jgi:hypothetical protein
MEIAQADTQAERFPNTFSLILLPYFHYPTLYSIIASFNFPTLYDKRW